MGADDPARDVHDFGIAVFLDVLGARVHGKEEATRLLQRIKGLLSTARDKHVPDLEDYVSSCGLVEPEMCKPRMRLVGDAILLTWVVRGRPGALLPCAVVVQNIFVDALEFHIPLRGAIGVGDIIDEDDIVLGSAVTDAAEWFERADIIGVIATPRCGTFLEWIAELTQQDRDTLDRYFIPHEVPLKGESKPETMWELAWPFQFVNRCRGAEAPPRLCLLDFLTRFDIPYIARQKYRHAMEFYDAYAKRWGGETLVPMDYALGVGAEGRTEIGGSDEPSEATGPVSVK